MSTPPSGNVLLTQLAIAVDVLEHAVAEVNRVIESLRKDYPSIASGEEDGNGES